MTPRIAARAVVVGRETLSSAAAPGFDRYYLHYRCFAAWDLERTKLEGQMH
jgi:hypothetical protein